MSAAARLAEGIARLDIAAPPGLEAKLLAYLALLQKWNKTYNLTAVREPARMVSHHLLDCLAVAPHVTGARVLDVGSGAGLPGIPLAVALPLHEFTLLEANHKKAAFLRQARTELRLDNVEVACERAERWRPGRQFHFVISRALSDLAEFAAVAGAHVAPGGRLAAMKGLYPHEEVERLPAPWRVRETLTLPVPGLRAERHLLLLARTGE